MQWFGIDLPLSCSVHRMELVCLCCMFVRVKGFDCYPIARDFWVSKLEILGCFGFGSYTVGILDKRFGV